MKTCDPIQQDWLSEQSVYLSCTVEATRQTSDAPKPEVPPGVTLPLFVEPNQVEAAAVVVSRVAPAPERAQLQRQLEGAWVAATRPFKTVDPVLEHLNSAMHLAESLRGPAKKCSYRQNWALADRSGEASNGIVGYLWMIKYTLLISYS